MDSRKGGKRYSTERQERLKNTKSSANSPAVTPKADNKLPAKVWYLAGFV